MERKTDIETPSIKRVDVQRFVSQLPFPLLFCIGVGIGFKYAPDVMILAACCAIGMGLRRAMQWFCEG